MKKILLIFILGLMLVGCADDNKPPITEDPTLTLTQKTYDVLVDEEIDLIFVSNRDTVQFISADPLIASVSNGKVKGLKVGTVTITLKVETIEVTATINVSSTITVSNDTIALEDMQTYQLDAVTKGATLEYSSSDDLIATVSESGLITGLDTGTATITISLVEKPSVTKTVEVIVTKISLEERQFISAKAATEALENFTIKVTITEPIGAEQRDIIVYYKFDGAKFEYQTTNGSTFYQLVEETYTKYTKSLEGYETSVVSSLPTGFSPFWIGLNFSDFDYLNESYFVKYGRESIFNSFTSQFTAAVLSNGILKLDTNYNQISFNLKLNSGEIYHFTFEFTDINETIVVIPE